MAATISFTAGRGKHSASEASAFMAVVAEVQVTLSGDIGGVGISRFRFATPSGAKPSPDQCSSAGTAVRQLYTSLSPYLAGDMTFHVEPLVPCYDEVSGLVQGDVAMTTSLPNVTGEASGSYPAGVGARINWKTGTISGRRLLKGSTFVVPMGSVSYAANGQVANAVQGAVLTAAQAYLSMMSAEPLLPVIWHRPPKHTTTGGLVGAITGAAVPITPAGLRSRRS